MEKNKVDDKLCSNGPISHLVSSSGESITNFQNPRNTQVSTVSSERVYSAEQTSIMSDFSSEAGQPINGKRKDLDSFMACHTKVLKTGSSSSKESGEVVPLSSVDSTDPILCQSSNEIFGEKRPLLTHSCESNVVSHERESSVVTNSDSIAVSLEKPQHCEIDLNEGMEAKGAIYVVAKVGVPMGSPKKPLHFGGELGWRSSSVSAFRPTSSEFSKIKNESYNIRARGIDLNVAAIMDSEQPYEECYSDFVNLKAPKRVLPDLNSHSENEDNCNKPGASTFDLNNNFEDTRNNLVHHSENQQLLRSVAADYHAGSLSGGSNVSQSIFDMRRPPSHWINLSTMRGFGHVQPQPFLVATTPNAQQVQTVVPSGLYIGKINNLVPKFYPPSVLPQLNNHHVIAPIPQIPDSVLAAYPGPLHLIENQIINPHAFANMRPSFIPNGSIPLMEDGNRGIVNPEALIPVRNALLEAREKAVEQAALPATQINSRQMASWI